MTGCLIKSVGSATAVVLRILLCAADLLRLNMEFCRVLTVLEVLIPLQFGNAVGVSFNFKCSFAFPS